MINFIRLNFLNNIWEKYVSVEEGVDFNILVQRNGLSYKKVQSFLKQRLNVNPIIIQEVDGKNYNQIGDMALTYVNIKKKNELLKDKINITTLLY